MIKAERGLLEKVAVTAFISFFCFHCRHYFAIPTNPGEQFYMFTSIAAWLLRTAGKKFEQPQEVQIFREKIVGLKMFP